MKWWMKRWRVPSLIAGLLAVGLAFTWVSGHSRAVSCGTGSGLVATSCREAESTCGGEGDSFGAADGVSFSYSWTCKDGTLTEFSFG
jgi:hypothetical protein